MRDIKFRAWLPNLNKMSYDVTLYANGWIESVTDDGGQWKHPPNGADVMQYTGLKDENGLDIYEGDIVKGKRFAGKGEFKRFIGKVVYRRVSFQIDGVGQYEGFTGEELHGNFEVLGNIYENPELIKESTT
jgi:uncharacterized phage protein (TIGR01671 family)